MKKSDVLRAIDEVMNNREIDSIRNAILAIRDKIVEMEDDNQNSDHYAVLELRGNNPLNCSVPYFDGAKYVVIDTAEKIDTGLYGCYEYCEEKPRW